MTIHRPNGIEGLVAFQSMGLGLFTRKEACGVLEVRTPAPGTVSGSVSH
jgi:hypothetical protein